MKKQIKGLVLLAIYLVDGRFLLIESNSEELAMEWVFEHTDEIEDWECWFRDGILV